MHCVWSRWPAWSGSGRNRLRCNALCCAGQHKPYAEWHKPCRYYRLLFRNLQAPPQIPATVFCGFPPALTITLPVLLPMVYAADFRGRFSTPSSQRRFCCWLPLLFPSADPSRLRRRPIGIFAGFLSAGLYQEPPPRFSPVPLGQRGCYGSCPAGGCPTFGAPVLSICYRWCRSIPKPHF